MHDLLCTCFLIHINNFYDFVLQLRQHTCSDSILARPYSAKWNMLLDTPRNELFVTIISGHFDKSVRKQDYNLQVDVSLLDQKGQSVSSSFSCAFECGLD